MTNLSLSPEHSRLLKDLLSRAQFKFESFYRLIDPLQYLWVISHLLTLIGSLFYGISILEGEQSSLGLIPWYDIAVYSSIATYSLVVYTRSLNNSQEMDLTSTEDKVPLCHILKSENLYLLVYSCLWAVTGASIIKIFPFGTYSFLNLMNHFILEAYPTHPLSHSLAPFIEYIEGPLLILSAHFDLAVIVLLSKECWDRKSLYSLIFYLFVWGLRVEYSDASRIAISNVIVLGNSIILNDIVPLTIREYWIGVRETFVELLSLDNRTLGIRSKESGTTRETVAEGKESVEQ